MNDSTERRLELGRQIYDAVVERAGYGVFAIRATRETDGIPSYVEVTTDSHCSSILDKRSDCADMTSEQLQAVLEMIRNGNSTITMIRRLSLR